MTQPNIITDVESFKLLREVVGKNRIVELMPSEAAKLARHFESHPDTVFVACSGLALDTALGRIEAKQEVIAAEWVREEKRRKAGEPLCNSYRYVFGITESGECFGYDVTKPDAGDGQVIKHWTEFDDAVNRCFYPQPKT